MSDPTKHEAPTVPPAEAPKDYETSLAILPPADADRKRTATLVARAALAGIVVTPQGDGTFLIRRWALSREVGSLDELSAALRLQGVRL